MTFVFSSLLELACVGYLSREAPTAPKPTRIMAKVTRKHKSRSKVKSGGGPENPDWLSSSNSITSRNSSLKVPPKQPNPSATVGLLQTTHNHTPTPVKPPLAPFFSREFDYDYRPPGFGLGLNGTFQSSAAATATNISSGCQCSCQTQTPAASTGKLPSVPEEKAEKSAPAFDRTQSDAMALKIDKISSIIFPTLFR